MAGIENLLNSKGAYATRRADLDRQIAELQNQLGYAGDGSFEGEMGWWDYAVHGDRSGLDAYASIKQNEQIQKRQFAENLVEQQNRAMRSLQEAQADVDDLVARKNRGEVVSAKDEARANAALSYAKAEASRVGLDNKYTESYGPETQTEQKAVPESAAAAPEAVAVEVSDSKPSAQEIIEDAEGWLENPDENGQKHLDALAGISDDVFRKTKKSLSARIGKAMEDVVGKKNLANAIAESQRVRGTKGVKADAVLAQRKIVEALPDSPEKQKELMELDNLYKKLSAPKDNSLRNWVAKMPVNTVRLEWAKRGSDLNTKGEKRLTQTINGRNYTYYLVRNGNGGIDVTDEKKRVLRSFSAGQLDYETPKPQPKPEVPTSTAPVKPRGKTDWSKVPGALDGDW